MKKMVVLAAMR